MLAPLILACNLPSLMYSMVVLSYSLLFFPLLLFLILSLLLASSALTLS